MMTYRWDEEAHQRFLRMKHPNYYAMDIHDALRELINESNDGVEVVDVDYEIISSTTPSTHDVQGTDKDSAQRGEGERLLEQGA